MDKRLDELAHQSRQAVAEMRTAQEREWRGEGVPLQIIGYELLIFFAAACVCSVLFVGGVVGVILLWRRCSPRLFRFCGCCEDCMEEPPPPVENVRLQERVSVAREQAMARLVRTSRTVAALAKEAPGIVTKSMPDEAPALRKRRRPASTGKATPSRPVAQATLNPAESSSDQDLHVD